MNNKVKRGLSAAMALAMLGGVSGPSIILMMACVALGYGIPYTFLSGFEMEPETVTKTEETTRFIPDSSLTLANAFSTV